MPPINNSTRTWAARLITVACLLLFFALGLRAALAMSPTNDEPAHILRGFVLRSTGGLQYQTGHAPLSHRLIGSFLTADRSSPDLEQIPSWPDGERLQLASELLWDAGVNVDRFLFLARLPILWAGVFLGALIGSWALAWHGRGALIVALVLFAASPNLLASAALATTDFITVLTYFGTIYAWWRYWRVPQKRWWLLTAVFLGLALATKLTAVLLLPVLFLLTLLFLGKDKPFWRPFIAWLALLPAAALVLWVVYGLQVDTVSGWPMPVPAAAYIVSWQTVLEHVERGHRAFFLGELSGDGWWSYFPVTYLIKTPLVTLILLLIALVVVVSRRALWRTALFLLLPAGALFAAAMTSRLNIGYRHILPMTPFLLVFASTAVLILHRWQLTRILLALALGWSVIATLRQQPHFLAYFNEFAGGTGQGYRYLGDSNLDWGQDLKLLADEVEAGGDSWFVSYAGVADPTYYGISKEQIFDHEAGDIPLAPANPAPGRYAISANHWQGILEDADIFDWFRRRDIDKNLGGSILIYDVQTQTEGDWVAHCSDPAPLLAQEEVEALLGQTALRHVRFNCRESWVLPDETAQGWYIVPQADAWWPQALMSGETSARLELVYRHRATADAPSYDVYYWSGGALVPDPIKTALSAETADGRKTTLPTAVTDFATLSGYQTAGDAWINFWHIEAAPDRPLSIRAHLYAAGSDLPLVSDALGYASDQWRAGDTLWQRHQFQSLEAAQYLETGFYDYQELEDIGSILQLPAP